MKSWSGTRVLVTGAGGFIGSHLAEELARRGAKVRAMFRYNSRNHWGFLEGIDRRYGRRVEVVAGDVTDPYCMLDLVKDRELVFHLAAQIAIPYSYVAPQSFAAVNVGGTLSVLEACRRSGARLVHTSTSEVYGTARYVPIDEGHPLQGQSPYSASKIGADKLVESYVRSFGVKAATVRPFNTYGPRQSARAVLPTILLQLLAGKTELRLGSTSPMRDFNYVTDTVAGFLAVASSPRALGETVNVGSGRGVTVAQAARLAMRVTGRRARLLTEQRRVRPKASEVGRLLCDNRLARKLGWKPRVALEEGLRLTAEYLRLNLNAYKADAYNV